MGQDHSREPTEPNITQMIGCLRLLQHRAKTEPRFKELLSIPTESTIEYDPQYVFHGTNEEFRFLIRCLEKLNDNVRNEEKMKADLEKLAAIQTGSSDDLKLLNQQITMIVEYNEKHITELNQNHEKIVSELKKEVDIKARWIKTLEKRLKTLEEENGVPDVHPQRTPAPPSSTKSTADLHEKLHKKQEKLRKFEEFICETNRKTLQTAIEFFKEDAGDMVDLHQKIANLNEKLAEKEREIQNLKQFEPGSHEKFLRIFENAFDRLLEKGISEETAGYALNMANIPRRNMDEEEWVQKAMEFIDKNRKKEEIPVLVLKSKKNEEEAPPPASPQPPTLGAFDYTDFKSTEYLISEGISRETLQEVCREVTNTELLPDAFKELERAFLTCLVVYIEDLPTEKRQEIIEKAWEVAGLEHVHDDDNGSEDSDDQFLEDDLKTRYNSEDESYQPEDEPDEPKDDGPAPSSSSSTPTSDWSHLEESESDEDDYY
ncbi:unnamed protein product [Caenorhabditis brenneri]